MNKLFAMLLLGTTMLLAEGIHWETDYDAAVQKAAKVNKPILFVLSSHACKWCRHLEQTTFSDPKVIAELNKDFVNVTAYADAGDYVPRDLWVRGTPILWFLDTQGVPMFQPIKGAIPAKDLLPATDIVLEKFQEISGKKRDGSQKP